MPTPDRRTYQKPRQAVLDETERDSRYVLSKMNTGNAMPFWQAVAVVLLLLGIIISFLVFFYFVLDGTTLYE
jgi:hypothetical protein